MVSVVGALFVLAAAVVLLTGPTRLPWVLAAAIPFGATSAVAVLGQSIVAYHLMAGLVLACSAQSLLAFYRRDLRELPGARPLLAFCLWALAITALCPVIFAGLPVLNPRRGIDEGVKQPDILAPTISNFAQAGYLVLAVLTVLAIALHPRSAARLPALGFALGTAMSTIKENLPDGLQKFLFENSSNVSYTSGDFNGVERMRGIFSEPSSLGAFSVAACIFFCVLAGRVTGVRRIACFVFAGWAILNAGLSFSGGAIVSGIIIVAIVLVRGAWVAIQGRSRISVLSVITFVSALPLIAIYGPGFAAFVTQLVTDKSDSSSGENRAAANEFSLLVLERTSGLGSGLGSNRPSSFVASMLSNVGLLGTMLLLVAIALILRHAFRAEEFQPAVWAAVALVVCKIISGPDISEPTLWFLLAVCAQGALRSAREHTPTIVEPQSLGAVRSHPSVGAPAS